MTRLNHLAARALPLAAVLVASTVVAPQLAHADIITALFGTPTAVSNGYAYTYNVQLSGGQVDPAGTVPASFGTVYDFGTVLMNSGGTLVSTTGAISNFTFAFNLSDTPAAVSPNVPADNPAVANIRFTYNSGPGYYVAGQSNGGTDTTLTGATALTPGAGNLGTFTVISAYGPTLNTRIAYDGQSYKYTNNTVQDNVGSTAGPLLPSAVPEPASLALLGVGVAAMTFVRRRRS